MTKIKTKIKIRISKKWLLFALMIFICAAATAYAGEATSTLGGTASNAFNDAMKSLANLLVALLQLLKKILWPIFLLIGGLLNNDLIFGAGMEERLLMIWTQIRNFVNIGFVIILVGVALYNVTGFVSKEEYNIGKFLPKFAIALIAVNFSYVALKIVLDVTNVFTVAIFAMPKTISADLVSRNSLAFQDPTNTDNYIQKCSDLDKKNISTCGSEVSKDAKGNVITEKDEVQKIVNGYCSTLYGPVASFKPQTTATSDEKPYCEKGANTTDKTSNTSVANFQLTQQGMKFFNSFTANNASLILAIQFMNIVDVDKVSSTIQANTATADFMKITMNLMFSSLLYIIYGVAYVSLFILLLVRLVVLWLIICLSPLIALKLAGIKFADGGHDFGKMFVDHAVAPVKLAIVLTIGYMMLDAFKTINIAKETNKEALGVTLTKLQTELSGLSTLQSFVMAAAAVIFIWVGVKEASKGTQADTYIRNLMGKFEGAGTKIAGLWKYAPVLPTGEGKQSFMQLKKAINAPMDNIIQKYSGDTSGEMSISDIQALRNKKNMTREEVQEAARRLQTGGFTSDRHTKETQELLKTWGKSSNEHQRELARRLSQNIGVPKYEQLMKKSKLLPGEVGTLTRGLAAVAGSAPLAPAPRTPAAPPAKTGPAGAQTPPGGAAQTKEAGQAAVLFAAQGDANNVGWKNLEKGDQDKVRKLLDARSKAEADPDVASRPKKIEDAEKAMKADPTFAKAAATVQASADTETAVTASASAVSAEIGAIKGPQLAALKKSITQAKQKLTANKEAGLSKDKINAILRQTLEKAGVKSTAIEATPDIKKLLE